MKLNLLERFWLLQTMEVFGPEKGNMVTLNLKRVIMEKLSYSEDDFKKFSIVEHESPNGGKSYRWDKQSGSEKVEITFGEQAAKILLGAVKAAEKSEQLHQSLADFFATEISEPEATPAIEVAK